MKFIMRTTGDLPLQEYQVIPNLIFSCIEKRDAYLNFLNALEIAEDEAAVHLEDDIILCDDFPNKIIKVIMSYPRMPIQFFSMRKDDLTIGTRLIDGAKFLMGQCFYLPNGMSKELLEFAKNWDRTENPTGLDLMIGDFLKGSKYLNYCPNLVDHKIVKSRINPKRSTKRQSLTFRKEI
jgi:hypothetical protein